MKAFSLDPSTTRAWLSRRGCAHVLRSDSAGLTLYINPVDAIAGEQPPHRAPYTLAYEAEGPNGEQLQLFIAETDSADAAQDLVELIEKHVLQIRRTIARVLGSEDHTPLASLADYGNIHAESTRQAVLARLQALAIYPLPECAYEGFTQAVCSSVDAWLSDQGPLRCDWVQQRSVQTRSPMDLSSRPSKPLRTRTPPSS